MGSVKSSKTTLLLIYIYISKYIKVVDIKGIKFKLDKLLVKSLKSIFFNLQQNIDEFYDLSKVPKLIFMLTPLAKKFTLFY